MSSDKIRKEYYQLIKKIEKYNKNYYDKNNPLVNDDEYDTLKKEIIFFEKKYNFLHSENSPSKKVGYKPSKNFIKVRHKVPMLSLANAFDEEDLLNFEKKNIKFYI